jgi:hypothetical protein
MNTVCSFRQVWSSWLSPSALERHFLCLLKSDSHHHTKSSGTSQTSKPHFHFYLFGHHQTLIFLVTTAHCAHLFTEAKSNGEASAALPQSPQASRPGCKLSEAEEGEPTWPGAMLGLQPAVSPLVLRTAL